MLYAKQIEFKEFTTGKKIPVGIFPNCDFTGTELGERYIDFNYKDSENRVNNKRVWFPELEKIRPKDGETPAEALNREELEAFAHIVKHLHLFLTPEEVNSFSAPDLKSAAIKAHSLLNPKASSKKVSLKLIPDSEGWAVFGRYPNYIELYEEDKPVTLKYSTYELNLINNSEANKVKGTDVSTLF